MNGAVQVTDLVITIFLMFGMIFKAPWGMQT